MERFDARRSPRRSRATARGIGKAPSMLERYGRDSRRVLGGQSERLRRRRAAAIAALVVLAVLASVGGGAWWAFSRPVAFAVAATPGDARLAVATCPDGAQPPSARFGTLSVTGVKAGMYTVTVTRTGFATRTVSVDARRFQVNREAVSLQPLPQALKVSAKPVSAEIRVTSADGRLLTSGKGKVSAKIPTQPVRIVVTAAGKNDFSRDTTLDGALSLKVSLDPKGQLVHGLGMLSTKGAPKAVAMTPDGTEAWATILNGPPSIQIFNPRTGAHIGDVDMGKYGAVEVVFNRAGTRAYASQMETAKVFEIDVATRKVLRGFKTMSAWTKVVALSPDEKTLYAANWSGNDVSIIDLESGKLVRRVPVAKTPRGLYPSASGRWLWVGSFGIGWLQKIDLKTYAVHTVFRGGGAMRHLVADESRGKLFTSDMAKDCVWITDMKTGATKRFAKVGHKPNTIALSPDGHVLFVSNRGANNPITYYIPGPEWGSILLLDAHTGKPLDGIVGGNQCTALGVSADGKLLVFSDFLDNRLRVYEVPPYVTLAAGHGGRSARLAHDVKK